MSAGRRSFGWAIRRFRERTPRARRLWLSAWWALLVADFRLRISPRRALARALAAPGVATPIDGGLDAAREAAEAVASAAAHHLWDLHCLPRALALSELLRSRRVAAAVRLGVRRDGAALAAHAWVEVAGVAVGEPEAIEDRFLPLVETARRTE